MALRRFTGADADELFSLDGDPQIMRFLEPRTRSRAEVRDELLPRLMSRHQRHPGFGYWAAEDRGHGAFLGWFGLRPVIPTDDAVVFWPDASGPTAVAEIGYRLRRSAWGHGYATEGARALVGRAVTEPGIREVVATTMAVNLASRRVLEKAGLTLVRTRYVDWPDPVEGADQGEVEYRLRR